MTEIDQTSVVGGTPGVAGGRSAAALREDFLRLLVTQMRFQDPLNPLDGADFTAQLAQFSGLEQLQNISGQLQDSVDADMLLARTINNTLAATLLGKEITAVDNRLTYAGEDVPVRFRLGADARDVSVEILTESGDRLRTITLPTASAGDGLVIWDGRDNLGNRVPVGDYRVRIQALAADGAAGIEVQPVVVGRVEGVRFIGGNPVLLVDGREILFGSVLEIVEPAGVETRPPANGWLASLSVGN